MIINDLFSENKKKYIKVNWSEVLLLLFFLFFCISYILQVLGKRFISIAFASYILIFLIPIIIFLISRNINICSAHSGGKDTNESNKLKSVKNSKSKLSMAKLMIKDILNVKRNRLIIIFLFSLGVIESLFGFLGFVLFFNSFTLYALGVRKVYYLIIIPCIVILLFYFIFVRMLFVSFPKGFLL